MELNAVTNCTLRKSKSREPRDRTVARAPLLERIPRLSPRAACGQTHEACGSAVLLATTCTARSLRAFAALGTTPPRACAWTAGGMAAWLAAGGPSTSDSMRSLEKKKNRAETDSHDSQRLHEHDGTSHNAARGIVRHITWTQNSHKLKEPPDGDMIYLPWSPLPCAAWVVAAMLSMPGARAPKAAAGRRRPEACVQTECPSPALACAAQTEYPVRVSVRIQCNTSKHMQSKGWNSSRRNYGQLHERNRPARICNALHFL